MTDWRMAAARKTARLAYARLLEREYRCERCRRRYATEMFDCRYVCSPCRRVLERKLVRHG